MEDFNIYQIIERARMDFKPIRKSKTNPYHGNAYAGLDDILDGISDAFRKHGLIIINIAEDNYLTTKIRLLEDKNDKTFSISTKFPISENDPQKIGSAYTYGRRYNLCNLLNLIAEEDDDGNQASALIPKKYPRTEDPEKPKFDHSGSEQNHMLLPGDVIPKWWWDLKKSDWKEAGKFMPKGYGPKKIDGKYIVAERDQTPIKYEEDVF